MNQGHLIIIVINLDGIAFRRGQFGIVDIIDAEVIINFFKRIAQRTHFTQDFFYLLIENMFLLFKQAFHEKLIQLQLRLLCYIISKNFRCEPQQFRLQECNLFRQGSIYAVCSFVQIFGFTVGHILVKIHFGVHKKRSQGFSQLVVGLQRTVEIVSAFCDRALHSCKVLSERFGFFQTITPFLRIFEHLGQIPGIFFCWHVKPSC